LVHEQTTVGGRRRLYALELTRSARVTTTLRAPAKRLARFERARVPRLLYRVHLTSLLKQPLYSIRQRCFYTSTELTSRPTSLLCTRYRGWSSKGVQARFAMTGPRMAHKHCVYKYYTTDTTTFRRPAGCVIGDGFLSMIPYPTEQKLNLPNALHPRHISVHGSKDTVRRSSLASPQFQACLRVHLPIVRSAMVRGSRLGMSTIRFPEL
jgi:hypothetical protein